MGLFDEIRRQVQEALDEAQGREPRPRPKSEGRQQRRAAPPQQAAKAKRQAAPAAQKPQRRRPPQRQETRRPIASTSPDLETDADSVREWLSDRRRLRQAIVLQEVLGPPVANRRGPPYRR